MTYHGVLAPAAGRRDEIVPGFDEAGNGDLAIAIRSALIRDGAAWAFAGAGIVRGSDPLREWQETEAKLATAMAFLRQATSGAAPQEVAA